MTFSCSSSLHYISPASASELLLFTVHWCESVLRNLNLTTIWSFHFRSSTEPQWLHEGNKPIISPTVVTFERLVSDVYLIWIEWSVVGHILSLYQSILIGSPSIGGVRGLAEGNGWRKGSSESSELIGGEGRMKSGWRTKLSSLSSWPGYASTQ